MVEKSDTPRSGEGRLGFSQRQTNALRRNLNSARVRIRFIEGRQLSYIEGWHAIAEANRIFGFESWDRETVETRCLLNRENKGSLHTVYMAKVRITVRASDITIVREGYGTGESLGGGTIGEAHERALKMAETDATKRALATFGKPFGLGLYLSTRRPPETGRSRPGAKPIQDQSRRRTYQRLGSNGRYYVPVRDHPPIDPALAEGQAEETGRSDSEAPGPEILPRGGSEHDPPDRAVPQLTGLTNHATIERASSSAGQLLLEKTVRRREPDHLRFVAAQPCLICGRSPSDAHHLKFAQPRAMGRKVSDEFTVPLCRVHHRQLHQSGNEVDWWEAADRDVDPLEIAKGLWEQSRLGLNSSTATNQNRAAELK